MINTSRNEQAAMVKGGQAGGRYLEQIGKTDLATLSDAEWALILSHRSRASAAASSAAPLKRAAGARAKPRTTARPWSARSALSRWK